MKIKDGTITPGSSPVAVTYTRDIANYTLPKAASSDASAATTARKSAAAPAQESGFNPLAIVGVAAGVIGLAIVGMFVFTKRR